MNCSPHAERGKVVTATRVVAGTPMCANCFSGKPVDQEKPVYKFERRSHVYRKGFKPTEASEDVELIDPVGPAIPDVAIDMGFAVRVLRQARDLSQRQLAGKMGSPRTFISKIENHKCVPNFSTIHILAQALDVTPYILITFATFRMAQWDWDDETPRRPPKAEAACNAISQGRRSAVRVRAGARAL